MSKLFLALKKKHYLLTIYIKDLGIKFENH